jgi:hypothetical protein
MAEKQRAMTEQDKAEQTEMRAEIVAQLQNLDLKQLLSVARFVGVTEAEIAEDLTLVTTTAA